MIKDHTPKYSLESVTPSVMARKVLLNASLEGNWVQSASILFLVADHRHRRNREGCLRLPRPLSSGPAVE